MPDKYYPNLTTELEKQIAANEVNNLLCVVLHIKYAKDLKTALKDMARLCELTEDAEEKLNAQISTLLQLNKSLVRWMYTMLLTFVITAATSAVWISSSYGWK